LQNITGGLHSRTSHLALGAITHGTGAFQTTLQNGVSGWNALATSSDIVGFTDVTTFNASRVARTSLETRPRNVAFVPRIHV